MERVREPLDVQILTALTILTFGVLVCVCISVFSN